MSDSLQPRAPYNPWNSPGQNTGVSSCSLLQEIFPTRGLNPGLLHCRWVLYHLSYQQSPRTLEWVVYPFSSRSSWPRNCTWVSCIAGGFLTSWANRKAHPPSLTYLQTPDMEITSTLFTSSRLWVETNVSWNTKLLSKSQAITLNIQNYRIERVGLKDVHQQWTKNRRQLPTWIWIGETSSSFCYLFPGSEIR